MERFATLSEFLEWIDENHVDKDAFISVLWEDGGRDRREIVVDDGCREWRFPIICDRKKRRVPQWAEIFRIGHAVEDL